MYSLISGLAMLVVFVIYAAGTSGAGGLEPMAGWLERVSIVIGFAWIALLAIRFLRSPAVEPQESHSQASR